MSAPVRRDVDATKAARDAHSDAAAQRDTSGGFLPIKGFPLGMERTVRRLLNKAIHQGRSAELTMTTEGGCSFTFRVGARTPVVGDCGVGGKKHSPCPRARGGVPRERRQETTATAAPPGLSPGGINNSNRQSSENQRQQPRHPARRAAKFREQMHAPSAATPAIEEPNSARDVANLPSQTHAASPSSEERTIMEATGASLPDARKALLTANGDADRAAETLLAPAASAEGNSKHNSKSSSSTTRPTLRPRRAAAPAPDIDDLLATNPYQHRPRAAGDKKGHEMPGHPPEDPPPSRTRTTRRGKG